MNLKKTNKRTKGKRMSKTEKYNITQHDYTMIQVKLNDIKSMLYCNENTAFIESELDNLSTMLKNAIIPQKQR